MLPQVEHAGVLTRDAYEKNPSTTLSMTGALPTAGSDLEGWHAAGVNGALCHTEGLIYGGRGGGRAAAAWSLVSGSNCSGVTKVHT